jgi:hypothetical protein
MTWLRRRFQIRSMKMANAVIEQNRIGYMKMPPLTKNSITNALENFYANLSQAGCHAQIPERIRLPIVQHKFAFS